MKILPHRCVFLGGDKAHLVREARKRAPPGRVTTKGKRRKRRPPKWRPQELLLGRFFWCRPRFVSAQSGNFALILADAAGLTTRVLFRLCGWTGLVSRQPLNTGSAVRRPGGLRESCRSCDDSSNEKNSRERTGRTGEMRFFFYSLSFVEEPNFRFAG